MNTQEEIIREDREFVGELEQTWQELKAQIEAGLVETGECAEGCPF